MNILQKEYEIILKKKKRIKNYNNKVKNTKKAYKPTRNPIFVGKELNKILGEREVR